MKCRRAALALLSTIATLSVAPELRAADCDAGLLNNLQGRYIGQQLGLRNEMEVTHVDPASCTVRSKWTYIRGDKTRAGSMELTLADESLSGTWQSGSQTGKARFKVRRNGQHWNGRMTGWKDQPPGQWDYTKVVKP